MKKSIIFASSLVFAGCLYCSEATAATNPKSTTITHNGKKITMSLVLKKENGEVNNWLMENNEKVSLSAQDCNINAYKIFFDAEDYCIKNLKKTDKNLWHKNIFRQTSNHAGAKFVVEALATQDSAIEVTFKEGVNDYFMTFFKSKNASIIKEATGLSLIGMTPKEIEKTFGKYQDLAEHSNPSINYTFENQTCDGPTKVMELHMTDGKVSEILLTVDPAYPYEPAVSEYCYYSELPEGWFTKGTVIGTNVKVRENPQKGKVIATIGNDYPEMMFAEIKDTNEEFPWVHIITNYDKENEHTLLADGWIYGKDVSPSFRGFNMNTAFDNCFEYFKWLPPYLGKAATTQKNTPDEDGMISAIQNWPEKGIKLYLNNFEQDSVTVTGVEITKDTYAFAGLKVGADLNAIKKFDACLNKANFKLSQSSKITANGSMKWTTSITAEELAEEEGDSEQDLREVTVETSNGKVSKIMLNKI